MKLREANQQKVHIASANKNSYILACFEKASTRIIGKKKTDGYLALEQQVNSIVDNKFK